MLQSVATDQLSQQEGTSTRRRKRQRGSPAAKAKRAEERRERKEAAELAAERAKEEHERRLVREKVVRDAQEAAARQFRRQVKARQKREALVTEQDIVLGSSLITYGAGLDVHSVITGFDLCRVTIKNLPQNAKREEIVHIFTQQGLERSSFFIAHLQSKETHQEATVLMKAEEGQAIAIGLEGIEFGDHFLTFEVNREASGNTMGSAARNAACLTVYWQMPSEAFVVTYSNMDEARRKINELDGGICKGQCIRAQINQSPFGVALLRYHTESSIKLTGFPIGTVPDHDLVTFSGSHQIRVLPSTSCGLEDSHNILRHHLLDLLRQNVKVETYQDLTPEPVDGKVRVKVQFETWEDAKRGYESINDKRLQHDSPIFRASLPDPHQYTIIIPKQQYRAQKKQWISLSEKKPDSDAHVRAVNDCGSIRIHVLGRDKKAVGSLKVRVEHMVAGERLDPEFWHPSFLTTNQVFLDRIYRSMGVYVRADLKTRSLKVYGRSDVVVEEACKMIKEEVDRLVDLETTELLDQASVGFFVRGGLAKLKEVLGEENATMSFGSRGCHITVKGGEEGKHQLNQLIVESLASEFVDQALPGDIEKETCPICIDEISYPEQLGCGHIYCSACLQHYLESAPHTKNFPLACIGDQGACKTPVSIPQIRRFLQPQVFQALVEAAFRSYLDQHAQELKFCTTPDCQQIYCHSPSTRILQCPSCFSTICSACDQEAHGGMTCQERRHQEQQHQDRRFDEWVAANGKRCPECRTVVEKDDGCNHIACRCGAHFCWTCGEASSATTIYDHMNTAHGGMYDEEIPAWANPDNVEGNIIEAQARLLAQAGEQGNNAARALRQQNALRAQVIENHWRQFQRVEEEAVLAALPATRRDDDPGSWCVVM